MEKNFENDAEKPDENFRCCDLLTEQELISFLRIPEVSKAADYHNVIENLKRMHGLPRVHICGKPLYPVVAIRKWIEGKTIFEK
jgi:hypothetical protein